jgi:hypothetical protein
MEPPRSSYSSCHSNPSQVSVLVHICVQFLSMTMSVSMSVPVSMFSMDMDMDVQYVHGHAAWTWACTSRIDMDIVSSTKIRRFFSRWD